MWDLEIFAPYSIWGTAHSLNRWHEPGARAEASFGWKVIRLIHPHQPQAGGELLGFCPSGGACSDCAGELCFVMLLLLNCSLLPLCL